MVAPLPPATPAAAQTLDEFVSILPGAITRVVPADVVTVSEVNLQRNRVGWHYQPADLPLLELRPVYEACMRDDPLLRWYADGDDGRAVLGSDLATRRQLHATSLYNELYRPLNIEYQLAFALDMAKPTMVGVVFHRSSSDFSEADRLTADLLRGHLVQAYRNAEAMMQSQQRITILTTATEELGRSTILLSRDRAIVNATPRAHCHLATYCSWPGRGARHRLPEILDAWLRGELKRRSDTALVAHPAVPCSIEKEEGRLSVRAVIQEEQVLLLLEEHRHCSADDPMLLRAPRSLGLSHRESQVLAWVAQGKTNPEIGMILDLSARTIQTHLDRVYRKLDVTSRAAAVAKAIEARALAAETM